MHPWGLRRWYHEGEWVEQKTPHTQLGGTPALVKALFLPCSPGSLLHAPSSQPGCFPVPSLHGENWAEAAEPGKRHTKEAPVPSMAPPEAVLPRRALPVQGGAHHQVPLRKPKLSFPILEKDK